MTTGILRLVVERGALIDHDPAVYERLAPCGHLILAPGTPAPTRRCRVCLRPDDEQPALFDVDGGR